MSRLASGNGGPVERKRSDAEQGETLALSSTGARLTRLAARGAVTVAAGVITAGFLGWEAGGLVAGLTVLSYLLHGSLAPRAPLPVGTGRLLRLLRRQGYYIISLPAAHAGARLRYLAVGPGGAFLVDCRHQRRTIHWSDGEWHLDSVPVSRLAHGLGTRADTLERRLRLLDLHPELSLVPILVVAGRLPQPAMRSGDAVVARPRGAVDFITRQGDSLDPADVEAVVTEISDRLAD